MPKAIGPNSAQHVLARMDKRSRAARHMKNARRALLEHLADIGINEPSKAQLMVVERAVWVNLHLALADAQTASGLKMSDIGQRNYLAWNNTYARLLMQLGVEAPDVPDSDPGPSDLSEYLAMKVDVG